MAKRTSFPQQGFRRAIDGLQSELGSLRAQRDSAQLEVGRLQRLEEAGHYVQAELAEGDIPGRSDWVSRWWVQDGRRLLVDGEHRQSLSWLGSPLQRFSEALTLVTDEVVARYGVDALGADQRLVLSVDAD